MPEPVRLAIVNDYEIVVAGTAALFSLRCTLGTLSTGGDMI